MFFETCAKVAFCLTQICTRLKEHQRAVSNFNSSKSALAEHVCETSHNIAWEDSRIITTNNRYGQRLCLEAWHDDYIPGCDIVTNFSSLVRVVRVYFCDTYYTVTTRLHNMEEWKPGFMHYCHEYTNMPPKVSPETT